MTEGTWQNLGLLNNKTVRHADGKIQDAEEKTLVLTVFFYLLQMGNYFFLVKHQRLANMGPMCPPGNLFPGLIWAIIYLEMGRRSAAWFPYWNDSKDQFESLSCVWLQLSERRLCPWMFWGLGSYWPHLQTSAELERVCSLAKESFVKQLRVIKQHHILYAKFSRYRFLYF